MASRGSVRAAAGHIGIRRRLYTIPRGISTLTGGVGPPAGALTWIVALGWLTWVKARPGVLSHGLRAVQGGSDAG